MQNNILNDFININTVQMQMYVESSSLRSVNRQEAQRETKRVPSCFNQVFELACWLRADPALVMNGTISQKPPSLMRYNFKMRMRHNSLERRCEQNKRMFKSDSTAGIAENGEPASGRINDAARWNLRWCAQSSINVLTEFGLVAIPLPVWVFFLLCCTLLKRDSIVLLLYLFGWWVAISPWIWNWDPFS